jgi:hypothetical protein
MAKTQIFQTKESQTNRDLGKHAMIYCPGCKGYHSLRIRMPSNPTQQEIDDQKANRQGLWTFNNDVEKPTFRASLLVGSNIPSMRCHSFITDGNIQYLSDCYHQLKNQTVELPEIDL